MRFVVMDERTGVACVQFDDRAQALQLAAECNREWCAQHLWLGDTGPYVVVDMEDEQCAA
jgi:hypothetical protein